MSMMRMSDGEAGRCGATEILLMSGRAESGPADPDDEIPLRSCKDPGAVHRRIDTSLLSVGRRLDRAMAALSPHRDGSDEQLRGAYEEVHGALGDLAAAFCLIRIATRGAPPAPPARRRRPWGG